MAAIKTLEELRDRLRDPSSWPEGFRWDYSDIDGCALGLCEKSRDIVERKLAPFYGSAQFEIDFHIPSPVASVLIFGMRMADAEGRNQLDNHMSSTTPERVAEAIDVYLNGGAEALYRFCCPEQYGEED